MIHNNLDGVIKIKPQKARYETLTTKTKLTILAALISLLNFIIPQISLAYESPQPVRPILVFQVGDYLDFFKSIEKRVAKKVEHEKTISELRKQIRLNDEVKRYLQDRRSPLANSVSALMEQKNWKKIIALSNAESSMCLKYPIATANCWGVGGSNLWNMGNNLSESVVEMNNFLESHPLRGKIKYSEMSFQQMNGVYKQPAGEHWLYNNLAIYNDLSKIENRILNGEI